MPKTLLFIPISTKIRIVIITHLCLIFSVVSFYFLEPSMTKWMEKKSIQELSKKVLFTTPNIKILNPLFESLPQTIQKDIKILYKDNQTSNPLSFSHIITSGFKHIFFTLPFYLRAWLLVSLLTCFGILFSIEGAKASGWLALLLLLCAIFYQVPSTNKPSLWPKEEEVLSNANLSNHDSSSLQKAWHLYLIKNYLHQEPQVAPPSFKKQVSEALYNFHVEQILKIKKSPHLIQELSSILSFLAPTKFLVWLILSLWQGIFCLLISPLKIRSLA